VPRSFVSSLPPLTAPFWIARTLAAPVGYFAAAGLASLTGLTLATALAGFALTALLVVQFAGGSYSPIRYWPALLAVSAFAWLLVSALTDDLSVPALLLLALLTLAVPLALLLWRLRQRTLALTAIDTHAREAWYWLVVLLASAWGALAASLTPFGYAASTGLAEGLVAAIAAARFVLGLDAVPAFWTAFLLTGPLGLLLGALLAAPHVDGGLALGPALTGCLGLVLLAAAVLRRSPNRG
jgi:uncharacterized membrane-anchored protein